VSEFDQTPKEIAKEKIEEEYADLIGLPWPGRRYPGCYDVIQKYVKTRLGRSLKSFSGLYTAFTDDAVAEEDGLWITRPEWGEDWDTSILQKNDLILFKIYNEALGGGYADKSGRAPNHGAIYLGDGWMLHQLWKTDSEVVELSRHYRICCVGVVRENAT
jgi:cell wall-associated NlpC family hydrolase